MKAYKMKTNYLMHIPKELKVKLIYSPNVLKKSTSNGSGNHP
jgi:hypothetical protein